MVSYCTHNTVLYVYRLNNIICNILYISAKKIFSFKQMQFFLEILMTVPTFVDLPTNVGRDFLSYQNNCSVTTKNLWLPFSIRDTYREAEINDII